MRVSLHLLIGCVLALAAASLAQGPPVLSPKPATRPPAGSAAGTPTGPRPAQHSPQRRSGEIARPGNPAIRQSRWPEEQAVPQPSIEAATADGSARELFEDAKRALMDKKPAEALALLKKLRDQEPKRFEVHYLLGIAFALTGKSEEAISSLRSAIALSGKSAEAHSVLCMALADTGRRFDAVDACREATRLSPNNKHFQTQLAGLYVSEGMAADAVAILAARRAEGESLVEMGTLADAYYLNTEYAKAAAIYETIAKRWPNVSLAYLRLSGVYDYLERPADAVAAAKKFAELEGGMAFAHLNLGLMLQASGLYFESVDSLLKAVDLDRANGWAYLALSESYETVGDRENLLGSLRHAYQYLPDKTFELSYRYGNALARNGNNAEALEPLERAYAMRPHPQTMMALGIAYVEAGEYDKGIELVERSKALSPLPPGITINFDHHKNRHQLLARFDEIIAEVQRNPDDIQAHNAAYSVYVYKGMNKEAERHGLEMVRLEPTNWRCYSGMASFYSRTGEAEKALAMSKKAAELNPNHVFYMSVAYHLTKLGRIDEAIESLKKSISIKPLLESHLELGDLWLKKGNRQAALKEYVAGQQIRPTDARPNFRLAWLYLRMGDREGAVRQYETLKTIAPGEVNGLSRAITAQFGPVLR